MISLVPSSFSFEQLFVVKDLLLSFCILICLFVLLNSKAKKVLLERERERKETRLISVSVFSNSFWVKAFACLLAFFFCLFVFATQKQKKKSVSMERERERRERETIDFINT